MNVLCRPVRESDQCIGEGTHVVDPVTLHDVIVGRTKTGEFGIELQVVNQQGTPWVLALDEQSIEEMSTALATAALSVDPQIRQHLDAINDACRSIRWLTGNEQERREIERAANASSAAAVAPGDRRDDQPQAEDGQFHW